MIDFLLSTPAFLKVGIVFISILITYRIGLPLGWSMILYSTILTCWAGAGVSGLFLQVKGFIQPQNYLLIMVILALLFFTEVLSQSGRMKKTIDALKEWLPNEKMLLGGLPALVGLLPMPGGALFSAPLVKSVDRENRFKPPHIVAINYWFRHIWEYWWPLYPGVILAIALSGVSSGMYYLTMIPFTPVAIISGYFFILKRVKRKGKKTFTKKPDLKNIAQTVGPILLLVIISISGSALLPKIGVSKSLSNLVAMLIGLLLALSLIIGNNKTLLKNSLEMFTSKKTVSLLLVVIGVQLFYTSLKLPLGQDQAHNLVTTMRNEFNTLGIPIILVMILLPLISGIITGIAFAYVGASFPLVFELLGADPPLNKLIATTTFSYGIGFVGMILSPVHICFVVTNEYFKSRMIHTYRYLIGPALTIFIATLLLSGLYYIIF